MAPQFNDVATAVAPAAAFPSSIDSTHNPSTSFLHHSYDKVLSTSRKLRKSCSLPNCSQRPGECMHCTCDGRCGQHEGGKCGVRREGSGKSCKRLGCPKDETCLHSTRATCCHCRNLVSSQSRSMKAKRASDEPDSPLTSASMEHLAHATAPSMTASTSFLTPGPSAMLSHPLPQSAQQSVVLPSSSHTAIAASSMMDKSVKASPMDKKRKLASPMAANAKPSAKKIKQAPTATKQTDAAPSPSASVGVPSLCEYPEWSRRRSTCNLVVVVEGTQFNLHKFPMLIACPELRTKLPSSSSTDASTVTLLKYAHFPGGAAAFELACIYAYTGGAVEINSSNVALLYCAARVLKMHVGLTSRCATLLETLAHTGTGNDAVQMLLQVVEIRKCLRNQSTDRMMALCVHAIASRYPYDTPTMSLIVKLPFDVFLHITQLVLNDRPQHDATANDVVARLCAQAHLAQVFRSAKTADKAAELNRVLDVLLSSGNETALQQQAPTTQQLLEDEDDDEEEGEIVEGDDVDMMLDLPHVKMENEWLAAAQFVTATAQ